MQFKTFDKLPLEVKTEILSSIGLIYDLTTERGNKAIEKEFPMIKDMIEKEMKKSGDKNV